MSWVQMSSSPHIVTAFVSATRDASGKRLNLLAVTPTVQTLNEEALGTAGGCQHRSGDREHALRVHGNRKVESSCIRMDPDGSGWM